MISRTPFLTTKSNTEMYLVIFFNIINLIGNVNNTSQLHKFVSDIIFFTVNRLEDMHLILYAIGFIENSEF